MPGVSENSVRNAPPVELHTLRCALREHRTCVAHAGAEPAPMARTPRGSVADRTLNALCNRAPPHAIRRLRQRAAPVTPAPSRIRRRMRSVPCSSADCQRSCFASCPRRRSFRAASASHMRCMIS